MYVWRRDLVIARRCGEVVEVLSVGGRFHATIGLAWTLCHFGGWRPWFSCPDCGRRVAVLYIVSAVRCRHCLNLSYNSKRGRSDAAISKAHRIRTRLGGKANSLEPVPEKPSGMHWRTYRRLVAKLRVAEAAWAARTLESLERLDRRRGRGGSCA